MARITSQLVGLPETRRTFSRLESEAFPRAAARAINSVATTMRAQMARDGSKVMGMKVSEIKNAITIAKAKASADPTATLSMRGRPFNLIRFKATQLKAGVKASPWGEWKLFPGSFIVTINGARLVAKRERRGGKRVGRLPIRGLSGPSLPNEMNKPAQVEARARMAADLLPQRLRSEMEYVMSRLRR